MPTINFIDTNKTTTSIKVRNGTNVKDAALDNDVDGIYGDCGGSCTCATCHVYVDKNWFSKLPKADEYEQDMLEFAADATQQSRLSCQITMSDELDGITITIPTRQY